MTVVAVIVTAGANDGEVFIDFFFTVLVFLQVIDVWPRPRKMIRQPHSQLLQRNKPCGSGMTIRRFGDSTIKEIGRGMQLHTSLALVQGYVLLKSIHWKYSNAKLARPYIYSA
jgi:hypothetical protein